MIDVCKNVYSFHSRGILTDEYRLQMQSREPTRYSTPAAPVLSDTHFVPEVSVFNLTILYQFFNP